MIDPINTTEKIFPVSNYSLAQTLPSGQAFRWRAVGGAWEGVVHGKWVRLEEASGGIKARVANEAAAGDWNWLQSYLQVEVDIHAVIASFPTDEHLAKAVNRCAGLRLLRQEPWECLASFILSSTKQIVQIQQIVEAVCARFGEVIGVPEGHAPCYSFPRAERIASAGEEELRCCKMGFRAPYLKGSAELVANGTVRLEELRGMRVEEAREALMSLPGVGRKIADCVLLFAYGFQEAFPVDVWVLKALRELYFPKRRPMPKRLLKFTQSYFGPNAGYAQQYLFHYMRTQMGRRRS